VGRYPQEIEAAVYFCCLEALQNEKYAGALFGGGAAFPTRRWAALRGLG